MNELEKARNIINETDRKMADLFAERMEAVKVIADYKKKNGIPIDDLSREEEMIRRNSGLVENDELRSYYVNFLRSCIDISKNMQHKLLEGMRVAYSGVEGAFANIAASKIFPDAKCVAFPDFKMAYRSVESGECDCVLLPVENSSNGDVGNVLDLIFFGSLFINGIYEADIIQNLLGVKGASVGDVKRVISHPQAIGQSRAFIEKHGFAVEETVNTAIAAKIVADTGDKELAAIGSAEAAEKFGLSVIASHINESNTNSTRFAVLSRSNRAPSPSDDRFILMFTVKNAAGSLGKAISVIGKHGFNLRALKSRPTKQLVWDYFFYAEGEGNINSEQGKSMINELEECCSNLKIAGSFEKEIKI